MIPTKQDMLDAHARIKPFIHRTPILTSSSVNEIAQNDIYFKCENFQKMGAFKMRGATNAIMLLSDEDKAKGVVTHSSGNFAQALSLAAKSQGVKAYIVMPSSAPQIKQNAVKGYGGEIVICEPTLEAREKTAEEIAQKTGATFVHPSNDTDVIIGQGTAAMELLEDNPDLEVIMTPVGGGGLIGGCSAATAYFGRNAICIGGEPFGADDAYHSLKEGRIIPPENPQTIADGLRTQLGHLNFPIIQKYVSEIIRVEEQEIVDAMRLVWERMKITIEPSSAVPLAALMRSDIKNKKIGIVISGGNVDVNKLPF